MKKFLTVLLALSVVFTYSFGTVFAADTKYSLSETETAIFAQAQKDVETLTTTVKANYIANYDGATAIKTSTQAVDITKEAMLKVLDDILADFAKAINDQAVAEKTQAVSDASGAAFDGFTKAEMDAYATNVHNKYLEYDTVAEITAVISNTPDFELDLLKAEYDVQKAEALAEIAKVDVTKYNDNVPADADTSSKYYVSNAGSKTAVYAALDNKAGYYGFRTQVQALVDDATKTYVTNYDYSSTTTESGLATNIAAVVSEGAIYTILAGIIANADVVTAQQEGWNDADLASAQKLAIADVEAKAAAAKAAETTKYNALIRAIERLDSISTENKKNLETYKEKLADLDGNYAAIVEVESYLINAETSIEALVTGGAVVYAASTYTTQGGVTGYDTTAQAIAVAKSDRVKELVAEAANLKSMTGLNGQPMYDSKSLSDALDTAIETVYNADSASAAKGVKLSVSASYDVVKAEMKVVIGTTTSATFELSQKVYAPVAQWSTGSAVYDEDNAELVDDIIDAAKEAIQAAKTIDAVDEAFLAAYAKHAAIPTLSDRNTAQDKDAYKDAVAEYAKQLKAAFESKKTLYGSAFTTDFDCNSSLDTRLVGNSTSESGLYAAYTVEEMKTIFDEAMSTITNLKTKKALEAEVKAINDAIAAVKAPATAADKDTLLGLAAKIDDFNDYVDTIGATGTYTFREALLESLVKNVADIEKKALEDEATAIAKGGVEVGEEAAVDALAEKVKSYNNNYNPTSGVLSGLVSDFASTDYTTVSTTDFVKLHVAAVEEAIAKIDASATPLDAAAVKAAREAYDALGVNTINDVYYAKLLSLENLVAAVEADKADLSKLTLKASTKKVGKKIKVTLKGVADAASVDGAYIQLWKSKNAVKWSFSKKVAVTATSTYITKPYKGKTYVKFRVVTVNEDGTKNFSAWSNLGCRIVK